LRTHVINVPAGIVNLKALDAKALQLPLNIITRSLPFCCGRHSLTAEFLRAGFVVVVVVVIGFFDIRTLPTTITTTITTTMFVEAAIFPAARVSISG
jgi:hypothetical protein